MPPARVFIFLVLFAAGFALAATFGWQTLNHRLFIPLARWLRWKNDDLEKTGKEVREILNEKKRR